MQRQYGAGVRTCVAEGASIMARINSYAHPNGVFGNHILNTSLDACALMDWRDHSTVLYNAIQAILCARDSSGGWKKCPFYYSGPSKKLAWGSEEITTGFCLEALSRYRDLQVVGRFL